MVVSQESEKILRNHVAEFAGQAPSDTAAQQNKVLDDYAKLAERASHPVLANCDKFSYISGKESENKERKNALLYAIPLLMYAADIAKAGIVMGNVTDVGHMEQWVNNKIIQEKSLALAEAISEIKITNLQTQVASLTSAVAETAQGECDKMLRLRNLDKVLTIKTNNNGSFEDNRANKNSRETELKNWLEALFSRNNHKPKFSLYIIEPKPNSPQKATAVLTVALEQNRFRIEQSI